MTYAQTNIVDATGKRTILLMHRLVLGLPPRRPLVDHADLDGLNNTRQNLRVANHSLNGVNRVIKSGSSQYRGVYRHTQNHNWVARLKVDGVNRHLGTFASEVDAAEAYDIAAKEVWGDFARLNF